MRLAFTRHDQRTQDYVKALISVMTQAEGAGDLENLHALCSCMQTIRK